MERVGTIYCLIRYPVKSMLGETLPGAAVTQRGLDGDRSQAVFDVESGKVASAKKPWLWRALLRCNVRTIAAAEQGSGQHRLELALPDGSTIATDDVQVDAILSNYLQRPVKLISTPPESAEIERAQPDDVLAHGAATDVAFQVARLGRASPPSTFFDYAPVQLITTSTLQQISAAAADEIEPLRYRPNVIIQTPPTVPAFAENAWVGRTLALGDSVGLQVLVTTPRCAVPTLAHGALSELPEALRTIMKLNRVPISGLGSLPCVGVYAKVSAPGRVECGDIVGLLS